MGTPLRERSPRSSARASAAPTASARTAARSRRSARSSHSRTRRGSCCGAVRATRSCCASSRRRAGRASTFARDGFRLRSSRVDQHSERRLVTCLFVDIAGSTHLGRDLGPERMQRVLADAFAQLSVIATAEGGTVEKYIGDAVFVLFGAPTAHADDVIRALRAAENAVRWSTTNGTVGIRGGIETGEALVDLDAIELRQRMAVGTCVNVAARLQQQAEIGEILVGPTALEAAHGLARFGEPRTLSVKGIG